MNTYNNIVLLKDRDNFIIHYEKYPIDEDILDIYINDIYGKRNFEYVYHWNNVNLCVRLNESLGIEHILLGGGRCNFVPNNLTFKEQIEEGYFDLDHDALEGDIRLKTDDKYFTKDYYIKLISEKIESTPNLYD